MNLITGVAGFIGFHTALNLLKKKQSVVGVDNLNSYYSVKLKKKRLNKLKKFKNFKFIKLDLSKKNNYKSLEKYISNIKVVIHLAGQAGVRYSIENPQTYIKHNTYAYINLLEFLRGCKNLRIILYASSSSVFGDPHSLNKNTPVSVYAASKLSMEYISNVYANFYKMKLIGMRFFTVYGPWGRPDMSLYKFTKNILSNKKIEVFNNGNHSRSFTYIDDIVDNILKIVDKLSMSQDPISKIVSIGNPKSVGLLKLIHCIEKYTGKKAKKKFLPMQLGDVKSTKAHINKEKKLFKFTFKTNMDSGVQKFIKWFLSEKH